MADNPSNLIQFKRGTMAALETLMEDKEGKDGTFYLTVDNKTNNNGEIIDTSSRLFIGRSDGSIVPVNQGIITVETVNALSNNLEGKWHAGDYAYVKNGNILAIYDGKTWKQINAVGNNTTNASFDTNVSVSNDGLAEIEMTITDSDDHPLSTDLKIIGENGIQIKEPGSEDTTSADLIISGDKYSISRSEVTLASGNKTEISLSSENTNNDTSIILEAKNNITLSTSENKPNTIEIEGTDFSINNISFTPKDSNQDGFSLDITQANSEIPHSGDFDPQISVGKTPINVHFKNGVANLPIYTIDEIDRQKRAFDAMEYMGTIGGNTATYARSFSEFGLVSRGNTFKVVAEDGMFLPQNYSPTNESIFLKKGDVIIATGTEYTEADPEVEDNPDLIGTIKDSTLKFDVIPSGDEIDTTYQFNKVTSTDANNNNIYGVKLAGSTDSSQNSGEFSLKESEFIKLEQDNDNIYNTRVITVKHAEISGRSITSDANKELNELPNAQKQIANSEIRIPVVSDINLDKCGHVTGWTIKDYNIVDTSLSIEDNSYTASGNSAQSAATVTNTLSYLLPGSDLVGTKDGSFIIKSENLNITTPSPTTAGTPEVQINFIWGSF